MEGATQALYLLHSMKAGQDFPELDRQLDVGRSLASSGIPVVEFRAAVVLGSGSISFEMLRYLSERLPAMTCPRWVRTRIQPIALDDVLAYLGVGLSCPPGIYEIGGADVTTYRAMIQAYASVRRLHRRLIVDLPLLSLSLSAYWVDLVTPVDRTISHALIQSLTSEVVVTDPAASALPVQPVGLRQALEDALAQQAGSIDRELLSMAAGHREGVHVVRRERRVRGLANEIRRDLGEAGGDLAWYGTPRWWKLRMALATVLRESFPLEKPATLQAGATVDWWQVVERTENRLVLRTFQWRAGDAWLGYEVTDDRIVQVAAFRERGVVGFLYWALLAPVHRYVFARMAARRIARAKALRRHGHSPQA
ncbi:MAG: SDR family oxidoreductase [Actinomycetota bacterium]